MSLRSRIVLSFLALAALTISVIAWGAYERLQAVVQVEAAIVGAAYPETYRWIDLPKSIDDKIAAMLAYFAPNWHWRSYCQTAWPYLVGAEQILIYAESVHGDLAQPLSRFPDLRFMRIEDLGDRVTSADWKQICAALRTLPKLEIVVLQGPKIVDDSVAPLAGHPSVSIVKIDGGRITLKSIPTFSAMPALKELAIEELLRFTPEERNAVKSALPHVTVILN
jgi:hypothetical protein